MGREHCCMNFLFSSFVLHQNSKFCFLERTAWHEASLRLCRANDRSPRINLFSIGDTSHISEAQAADERQVVLRRRCERCERRARTKSDIVSVDFCEEHLRSRCHGWGLFCKGLTETSFKMVDDSGPVTIR